jgi:hypothetical protein
MTTSATHESGFLLTDSEIVKIAKEHVPALQKPADKPDAEFAPLVVNIVKFSFVYRGIPATISRIAFKPGVAIPNDGIWLVRPNDKLTEFSENDNDIKKTIEWLRAHDIKKETAQFWHKVPKSDMKDFMTY